MKDLKNERATAEAQRQAAGSPQPITERTCAVAGVERERAGRTIDGLADMPEGRLRDERRSCSMGIRTIAGVSVAVMVALGGTAAGRSPGQDTSTSSISFDQGVNIMRLVASAEHEVFGSRGQGRDRQPDQGGYGTLAETIDMIYRQSSPESLETRLPKVTVTDAVSASLLDYTLRVIRSEDRQRYSATLTPVKGCGLAFSVDDRSVIYTGKSIGC